MKKTAILLISFMLLSTITQAQIRLKAIENGIGVDDNTYYKDIYNALDGFQGTYEYSGTDFYFKIKLVKRSMKHIGGTTWWDIIEGTYQFKKNGVDANYLNDPFDNNHARIQMLRIRRVDDFGLQYFCPDCLPVKWLSGMIKDRLNNRIANISMAKRIVNGEEGLQLGFYYELFGEIEGETEGVAHLPEGKFFARKIN
jgi:hypothetical protein